MNEDSPPPTDAKSDALNSPSSGMGGDSGSGLFRFLQSHRIPERLGWGTLILVGTWLSLLILYKLAALLCGENEAMLICILVFCGVFGILIWYRGTRLLERLWPNTFRKPPTTTPPQKSDFDRGLTTGILLAIVVLPMLRGILTDFFNDGRPSVQKVAGWPSTTPGKPASPGATPNNQQAVQRYHSQQATLKYWQFAVADLHSIRFGNPSETESAEAYYQRMSRELRQKVKQARAASTTHVDPDLIAMVKRHLELDDRILSSLSQIPRLMKQHQIKRETEPASHGALKWEDILAKLKAQPELWETLPSELQQLINEAVELEHQEFKQLSEIQIQQAVLQERYRGTMFPLPEIPQ